MHKFKVGQTVQFDSNTWYYRNTVPGSYEVRKQLPERNGEFEYHVKSTYEAHERVATESQIRAARVPTAPVAVFEQLSGKSLHTLSIQVG